MSTHPLAPRRKPAGQPTRGKTAPNRLRRVDNFLAMYDAALLRRGDGDYAGACFVDLGYGAEPFTTLESAVRLRRVNPALAVLGVEIDPARVAAAQPYVDDLTSFRLGGFNLPLQTGAHGRRETVRLVRAFNVLRQYEAAQVDEALARLAQCVLPGGLLIEGTSDPFGRIWVANVLRRTVDGWTVEALVFSTNFRTSFDPGDFQTVLPKNLIHRVAPGEPIAAFFQAWKHAALATRAAQVWGVRTWFVASAQQLAAAGYAIDLRRQWLRRGYLIWRSVPAVPLNL